MSAAWQSPGVGMWVTVSAGDRLVTLDSLSNLAPSDLAAGRWADTKPVGPDLPIISFFSSYVRHLVAEKLDTLNPEKLRNLTNIVRFVPHDTCFNDLDEALRSESVGVHRRPAV
jgi:hypothetical protein